MLLLVVATISYQVGNFWWAVVAAIAALFVLIIEVLRFKGELDEKRAKQKRAKQIAELFSVEIMPADRRSRLHLRFTIIPETYVEFLAFHFDGNSRPRIIGLDDYQRSEGKVPFNVVVDSTEDGIWYWNYTEPWHRIAGAHITVGLDCEITDMYQGNLVIKMTTADAAKVQELNVNLLPVSTR